MRFATILVSASAFSGALAAAQPAREIVKAEVREGKALTTRILPADTAVVVTIEGPAAQHLWEFLVAKGERPKSVSTSCQELVAGNVGCVRLANGITSDLPTYHCRTGFDAGGRAMRGDNACRTPSTGIGTSNLSTPGQR